MNVRWDTGGGALSYSRAAGRSRKTFRPHKRPDDTHPQTAGTDGGGSPTMHRESWIWPEKWCLIWFLCVCAVTQCHLTHSCCVTVTQIHVFFVDISKIMFLWSNLNVLTSRGQQNKLKHNLTCKYDKCVSGRCVSIQLMMSNIHFTLKFTSNQLWFEHSCAAWTENMTCVQITVNFSSLHAEKTSIKQVAPLIKQ